MVTLAELTDPIKLQNTTLAHCVLCSPGSRYLLSTGVTYNSILVVKFDRNCWFSTVNVVIILTIQT